MIDILKIRNKLAVQLVAELGVYTLPIGASTPAIYTVNNVDLDPPRDWKISGVECLHHALSIASPWLVLGG